MRIHALASASLAIIGTTSAFIDDTRDLKWNTLDGKKTQLVGHRGEKAFMPEHSLGSYWQAALEGADFIEPDLTLTKDGHLVVNHNEWIGDLTNAKEIPELQKYRRNLTWTDDDGTFHDIKNEYFIHDMTLEDIKKVRTHQANMTFRPQIYNGYFGLLTFEEYLQTIRELTVKLGRPFGVIPELKSPKLYNTNRTYSRYFEDRAIITLNHYGWAKITKKINTAAHKDLKLAPVKPLPAGTKVGPSVWQCFDQDTAKYLSSHTDVPVVALNENTPAFFTPKGLDQVAKYAKIVSPWKDFFVTGAEAYLKSQNITWDPKEIKRLGGFIAPDQLAKEIHKRGMTISPYTFYDSHQNMLYLCQDPSIKPASRSGFCPKNKTEEFFYFFDQGMDYMFVEDIVEANVLRILYANKLENQQRKGYYAA
ncbi:PLC-like phosphodiesterase [Linderina pennispora]|uniref:glycerophosphodiester phosphodiesterase n=1 Tax=Linderina pennispora TaxID=61395 RepID=A0A1Y1VUF3_9FUNG|nr:PLC-like phosphodiesterase [Linderina pennispora]ORX64922.1 PLC-like phosphodiesterase [Linderina pennispora]